MRVGIAADHGGIGLKEEMAAQLRTAGHEVIDFGAVRLDPDDDYPDFVAPLARAVAAAEVERGVAICGSGVGACVCANKIAGVRAALIEDHFSARQGVEDDHLTRRRDSSSTTEKARSYPQDGHWPMNPLPPSVRSSCSAILAALVITGFPRLVEGKSDAGHGG
jgi:hypothetical protein